MSNLTVVVITEPKPGTQHVLHYGAQSVAFENVEGVMTVHVDEPVGGLDEETGAVKVRTFEVAVNADVVRVEVQNAHGVVVNTITQKPETVQVRQRGRNDGAEQVLDADGGISEDTE